MDLLTFGQVVLYDNNHYVWLVPDIEKKEYHLAKILDVEKTQDLVRLDQTTQKRVGYQYADSPMFAYVILTTDDFKNRAAHLHLSGNPEKSFTVIGALEQQDVEELKNKILEGVGLPPRLVNLVKKLY